MVIRSIIALIAAIGSLFAALTSDGTERHAVAETVIADEMCRMIGCCCNSESYSPFVVSGYDYSVVADAEYYYNN